MHVHLGYACGFAHTCFTLASIAKPLLQGNQVLMPEARNDKLYVDTKQPRTFPMEAMSVLAMFTTTQNDHTHSKCVARVSRAIC